MSGELKPKMTFKVGQVLDGIWHHDRVGTRGRGPTKPPEEWVHREIRVVKVARKYVYFEIGTWSTERQAIDCPSRHIGGYDIDFPELDEYEARVAAAHEAIEAYGFDGGRHYWHGSDPHDADLFAVAALLRKMHEIKPDDWEETDDDDGEFA
jgi:hypothetical protein